MFFSFPLTVDPRGDGVIVLCSVMYPRTGGRTDVSSHIRSIDGIWNVRAPDPPRLAHADCARDAPTQGGCQRECQLIITRDDPHQYIGKDHPLLYSGRRQDSEVV